MKTKTKKAGGNAQAISGMRNPPAAITRVKTAGGTPRLDRRFTH
jgi:hypothetical protein